MFCLSGFVGGVCLYSGGPSPEERTGDQARKQAINAAEVCSGEPWSSMWLASFSRPTRKGWHICRWNKRGMLPARKTSFFGKLSEGRGLKPPNKFRGSGMWGLWFIAMVCAVLYHDM